MERSVEHAKRKRSERRGVTSEAESVPTVSPSDEQLDIDEHDRNFAETLLVSEDSEAPSESDEAADLYGYHKNLLTCKWEDFL